MEEWLVSNEKPVRLSLFLGLLVLLFTWERLAPRRKMLVSRLQRWWGNISLVVTGTLLIRFLFPLAAIGVAAEVSQQQLGLLNSYRFPEPVALLLALLMLDFVIYLQHAMFHMFPLLWRLHRVHHSDIETDVTTGLRFHPLELVLSMLVKFIAIILIGPSVAAVIVFEIILNLMSMFTHSNIRLPRQLDWLVRLVIVTPDMHRIHHSARIEETNSNFGFHLSFWDRLLGTYIHSPRDGQENMVIGLDEFRGGKWNSLRWLLYMPFVTQLKRNPMSVNRRDPFDEQD